MNASQGLRTVLGRVTEIGGLAQLCLSIPHAGNTLARYIVEGLQQHTLESLLYVGTAEDADDDFLELQRRLGIPAARLTPLTHAQPTPREGETLARASVNALKRTLAASYSVLWLLVQAQYLSHDYYLEVTREREYLS